MKLMSKNVTRTLAGLLLPAALLLSPAATATATAATSKPAKAAKVAKAAKTTPKKKPPAPAAAGGALWSPPAAPPPAPPADDKETADDTKTAGGTGDATADAAPKAASATAKGSTGDTKAKESTGAAPPAVAAGPAPDLDKLRADYDRLRDDLFKSRSRAQIVEDALYKAKLGATFRWKGAPDYLVHHASIRLDGGEIWDSGDKPVTDDLIKVAERGVKAGPHALTLHIEIRPGKKSKDSDKLGYSSEHTFAIIVPEGQRTQIAITGDEDGDAPEYEPQVEVEVESEK